MDQEKEYKVILRAEGNNLAEAEIKSYNDEGWDLVAIDPQITFIPIDTMVLSGPTYKYIFSRDKK
jgi:hypothetical protein